MVNFEIPSVIVHTHRTLSDAQNGLRRDCGPEVAVNEIADAAQALRADATELDNYVTLTFGLLDALHRAGYDAGDLADAMLERLSLAREAGRPVPPHVYFKDGAFRSQKDSALMSAHFHQTWAARALDFPTEPYPNLVAFRSR